MILSHHIKKWDQPKLPKVYICKQRLAYYIYSFTCIMSVATRNNLIIENFATS